MLFAIIFKFSDCFGGQIEHKAYNLAHLILFTVGGGEDTANKGF